jgi:hypothetical protein
MIRLIRHEQCSFVKTPPGIPKKLYLLLISSLFILLLTACGGKTATPEAGEQPPLDLNYDLAKLALVPADTSDLFPESSFSIKQPFQDAQKRGLEITYPTSSIQHTIAFAEGYSTRLEIYPDNASAASAYQAASSQQTGTPIDIGQIGNGSQAYQGKVTTPEGAELDIKQYLVLLRQRNVLAYLTIRTKNDISGSRLARLAQSISDRINP